MIILGNIWSTWTTRESLINAARRVGITSKELSVNFMQQDKFDRAEACIDLESSEPEESSSFMISPNCSLTSPDKRRGSAEYWMSKFEQAVGVIKDLSEDSIKVDQIPGFMTIQKVKPKPSKMTTRVTQVHGSMKGKNILTTLQEIGQKNTQKKSKQDEATKKKVESKQAFIMC